MASPDIRTAEALSAMQKSLLEQKAKGRKPKPIEDRFWQKVEKTDSCWIWRGYICRPKHGYGLISAGGKHSRLLRAHRLSWVLHFGTIPDGLFVLHKCDNGLCVNPDHLFLGTIADNNYDMIKKGRAVFPRDAIAAKEARNAR